MPTKSGPTTEQRILEAATVLFYEKGYHAATMREVAAAVGIKAGSLYNHFPSKEVLLYRIARGTMDELLAGGTEAIADHDTPREKLRALVRFHVAYHAEKRFQARIADEQLHALGPEFRAAAVDVRDEYTALFKTLLGVGYVVHGWHVPDIAVITFGIGGMCTFVDTWYREDGPLAVEQIADIYADFVIAALEGHDSKRSLDGS